MGIFSKIFSQNSVKKTQENKGVISNKELVEILIKDRPDLNALPFETLIKEKIIFFEDSISVRYSPDEESIENLGVKDFTEFLDIPVPEKVRRAYVDRMDKFERMEFALFKDMPFNGNVHLWKFTQISDSNNLMLPKYHFYSLVDLNQGIQRPVLIRAHDIKDVS